MTILPAKRALISVSDKTGLLKLAKSLRDHGVELISTGGTAKALREAGFTVISVSELTQFPEMMDGRVKTLHPNVHGGLLALRDDPAHIAAMQDNKIKAIDVLVVNLYPFEQTIATGASYETAVENIDIGGPAMIRAAAKNHRYVTVVTDPADYKELAQELDTHGGKTPYQFRQKMSAKAFARTAAYDAAVSGWMADKLGDTAPPRHTVFAGRLVANLRYGENPHQAAAFYASAGKAQPGVASAVQHQGKALSYNNINDTDAAFELIAEFDPADGPACAIIKHANPCGVAQRSSLLEAYRAAFNCDQTSAFGGIVALNQPLDVPTAHEICKLFTEVVICPGASQAVLDVFAERKNLRLLTTEGLPDPLCPAQVIRQVSGGYLVQNKDVGRVQQAALQVVTKRAPTTQELTDMKIAMRVAKHVKSNAIVYVKEGATIGIGAGQMSRIDSTRIAARKAQDMAATLGLDVPPTQGSVVASDAFFPFEDGLIAAAEAGATAIIQPGGSMRDAQVIAAADKAGLAMVFTNMRHFRH